MYPLALSFIFIIAQVQLPEGATNIPIIIASDKIPMMRHTGGLEMHPVFVTIGNIQSDLRMQVTSYAWCCVSFIPIPNFKVHHNFETILKSRLFHQCMDIIFDSLKTVAEQGAYLTDPTGRTQHCFTLLISYVTDLPKQQPVSCVAKNTSPLTTAQLSEFGDDVSHNPRTSMYTLQQIFELCKRIDPWDIIPFQKAAKAKKLFGIHQPFWRDWRFADPAHFLTGEILHTCHKFFFDHVFK